MTNVEKGITKKEQHFVRIILESKIYMLYVFEVLSLLLTHYFFMNMDRNILEVVGNRLEEKLKKLICFALHYLTNSKTEV